VVLFHNFGVYKGFRLSDNRYSAHHKEKETLLPDGTPMTILSIDEIQAKNVEKVK